MVKAKTILRTAEVSPKFNLLDEAWIKGLAINEAGKVVTETLSICEVFEKAHTLKSLSGELRVQDLAVLRLLLSILHAVYTRTDEYKEARDSGETEDALALWRTLYNAGKFDIDKIKTYLEQYHERFYLIHPERPFYQVSSLLDYIPATRSSYGVRKLVGDIAESNNKSSVFSYRNGFTEIEYGEAARWLLYWNAYDDSSNKPAKVKHVSSGISWLGGLGLVYAEGTTLFDTLMLNFVLYNVDQAKPFWDDGFAPWELDTPRVGERVKLPYVPKSQIELLTLQSRRTLLLTTETGICGFNLVSGDFIPKCDAVGEQMTLLTKKTDSVTSLVQYEPLTHRAGVNFWRGFSSLLAKSEKGLRPGVLRWLAELEYAGIVTHRDVTLHAAGITYKNSNAAIGNVWDDEFTLGTAMLSESAEPYVVKLGSCISLIEGMVADLCNLAVSVEVAKGFNNVDSAACVKKTGVIRAGVRVVVYANIDQYFRKWLVSLDVLNDDVNTKIKEMVLYVQGIVLDLGLDMCNNASDLAYKCRSNRPNVVQAHIKFKNLIYTKMKRGGYTDECR